MDYLILQVFFLLLFSLYDPCSYESYLSNIARDRPVNFRPPWNPDLHNASASSCKQCITVLICQHCVQLLKLYGVQWALLGHPASLFSKKVDRAIQ